MNQSSNERQKIDDMMDSMIDNELSREYEVNCVHCGTRLKSWFRCDSCYMIYFCDCSLSRMCGCLNIRELIRSTIEDISCLYTAGG